MKKGSKKRRTILVLLVILVLVVVLIFCGRELLRHYLEDAFRLFPPWGNELK